MEAGRKCRIEDPLQMERIFQAHCTIQPAWIGKTVGSLPMPALDASLCACWMRLLLMA